MRSTPLVLALARALASPAPAFAEDKVVVFAAASLKTALDARRRRFTPAAAAEVALSYGGSLGLARQLVAGAPADVFISADEPSMDAAAEGKAIKPESRADFLRNRLVVVAPENLGDRRAGARRRRRSTAALGAGKLATGEVKTVPVGRYAQESLTKLGLWATVEPKLAMTDNVRAALEFVARGEAPLGIVYATDAASEPRVKIVARLPDSSHAPIVYPAGASRRRQTTPPPPSSSRSCARTAATALFESKASRRSNSSRRLRATTEAAPQRACVPQASTMAPIRSRSAPEIEREPSRPASPAAEASRTTQAQARSQASISPPASTQAGRQAFA